MGEIKWHHRKKASGEETSDLVSTTLAQFSDKSSLLRENLQNSLDRRLDDSLPVTVCINVARTSHVNQDDAEFFLQEEWSAIQESDVLPSDKPSSLTELDYITIEEFNTTGLKGNCRSDNPRDAKEEENDFWHFFRASGISGKSGASGGRWGAGKMVYNAVSRIRTALFYSVRDSTKYKPAGFVMGVSHLGPFTDNEGVQRVDKGVFGQYGDRSEFYLPVSDQKVIDRLIATFKLSREANQHGLSVVIPFPVKRLKEDDFLRDCVSNYLFRILSGHLVLEIQRNGRPYRTLNRIALRSVCSSVKGLEKFGGALDFAEWVSDLTDDDYIFSDDVAGLTAKPSWSNPPFSSESLDRIKAAFDESGEVALAIRVYIEHKVDAGEGVFYIAARRTIRGQNGRWQYVRAGMSIPHARSSGTVSPRLIGLTYTSLKDEDEDFVSAFLGDCENPSHTNWLQDIEKATAKGYKYRADIVKFVKDSASWLSGVVDAASQEKDVDTLADLFPNIIQQDGTEPSAQPGADDTGAKPVPNPHSPPAQPIGITVSNIRGGFVLGNTKHNRSYDEYTVWIAYATFGRNSFRLYDPTDFDLNKETISLEVSNAEIIEKKNNCLRFKTLGEDFSIRCSGFDTKSSLEIKVEKIGV